MSVEFGHYRLERWLAQGGMANVFLATYEGPLGFEREVALKIILPEYANNKQFIEMFLDEARLAARLAHPNIVQVHDLGRERAYFYIAMEYVCGPSLSAVLARAKGQGRRLRPGLSLYIVSCLLAGLQHAHTRCSRTGNPLSIVHRDVNPQNVLLDFDGAVKLADFGVARANDNLHHTRAGVIKGKYAYMAPEQCLGQPLDGRADTFAAGIVLHEMLTGRPLFARGSQYETMKAALEEEVPLVRQINPDCPPELDALVLKALARDPEKRFQSAAAFQEAISVLSRRLGLLEDPFTIREFLESLYGRRRPNLAQPELPGVAVTEDRISMILKGFDSKSGDGYDDNEFFKLEPSRGGTSHGAQTSSPGRTTTAQEVLALNPTDWRYRLHSLAEVEEEPLLLQESDEIRPGAGVPESQLEELELWSEVAGPAF